MLSLGAAVDLTLAEHVHAAAELALEKNRHDCGEASWLRVDAHTTTDTKARTHIPHTTHTKAFVWSARKHHHTSTRVNSHQRKRTSRWELRGVTEVVEEVRVGMRHNRHYSQVSVCRAVTLSQGHTGTQTHTARMAGVVYASRASCLLSARLGASQRGPAPTATVRTFVVLRRVRRRSPSACGASAPRATRRHWPLRRRPRQALYG